VGGLGGGKEGGEEEGEEGQEEGGEAHEGKLTVPVVLMVDAFFAFDWGKQETEKRLKEKVCVCACVYACVCVWVCVFTRYKPLFL
jgi:hypothetical protein